MKRFVLLYVLPTLALLFLAVAPLIQGTETLFYRDVMNTHFPKKVVQAEAMMDGHLPMIDHRRDGGQPFLGNPNAVPFYPDNVLYTVASPLWALNAHFWIHLLLAPFAFFWLGRAWGLGRQAAWAGGVLYAGSGYFLSVLNLYNMVAGTALAPAFVAAVLELERDGRTGSRVAMTAGLWALLIVGGDPMTAVMGLFLAVTAVAIGPGLRRYPWRPALAALILGTLLATPQWVEFLRILPLSFRGHAGFSTAAAVAGSWNPAAVLEWLIPFAFGLPDLSFWGGGIFAGETPFFLTLYPGVLALILVFAGGRPSRPVAKWALVAVGVGLFLASGRYNPGVSWLLRGPGAAAFRLPAKFWLLVAMGSAMLCALGFERLLDGSGRRAARRALAWLAGLYGLAWLGLTFLPGAASRLLRGLVPEGFGDAFVAAERVRWAGLCLLTLLVLAVVAVLLPVVRRRPVSGGAVLLALHLAVQLFFMRPALPTDETAPYLVPPELLTEVSRDDLVVWGSTKALFGASPVPRSAYPDQRLKWLQRQVFRELQPAAGILWGRRYELSLSPEGLDSFLSRATAQAFHQLNDLERVRLLAASGVNVLLLARPLEDVPVEEADLVGFSTSTTGTIHVYRLLRATPEVFHAWKILRAPHLNAAVGWLTAAEFDPADSVILPGEGPPVVTSPGRAEVILSEPEALQVRVESDAGGVLVVQRAWLPLWRAYVDGEPAPTVVANMHRLAVEVPAASHLVELRIHRKPLLWSLLVSALAFLCLLTVALRSAVWPARDS